jgi:hypothetical protein
VTLEGRRAVHAEQPWRAFPGVQLKSRMDEPMCSHPLVSAADLFA